MDAKIKDDPKFMQECLVIDATRLINKYAKEYDIPAKWVMSRFNEGSKQRTLHTRQVSSHARHRAITELADMGYPRGLVGRSFNIGGDAVNSIISKFRKTNKQTKP